MNTDSSFLEQYRLLEHSDNFKTIDDDSLENKKEFDKQDDAAFEDGLKSYAAWLGRIFCKQAK